VDEVGVGKKKPKAPTLDLRILSVPPGLPALSVTRGADYADAAAVCLEHNGHEQHVKLAIAGTEDREFRLVWSATTQQIRKTHADLQDATEEGAYAVAIAVSCELTGLTVIERAVKGTHFDYWLGKDAESPFQDKSRLEISGILKGTEPEIRARIRNKVVQTQKSDSMKITAYVCVVEFGRPQVFFVKR
jgi:hypothetical protein